MPEKLKLALNGVLFTPFAFLIAAMCAGCVPAQPSQPAHQGIVFLGDSLTDFHDYEGSFREYGAHNQGIAGDTTVGVLQRLDAVVDAHPSLVFVEIGVNDLALGVSVEDVVANYRSIAQRLVQELSGTTVYVESIYPVSREGKLSYLNEPIEECNDLIAQFCNGTTIVYLDIATALTDDPAMFVPDGVHLSEAGYEVVERTVRTRL